MIIKPKAAAGLPINNDTFTWSNPFGGDWGTAANWMDITAGTTATAAPGIGNAVSITGGAGSFTNINGTGTVAQLTVSNSVILWGSTTVNGAITLVSINTYPPTDLELDGGAVLTASSLTIQSNSTLEVGGGSKLTISGNAALSSAYLSAMSGSTVQLGGLVLNNGPFSNYVNGSNLAVDDNSSIEIGSVGTATPGTITIDKGQTIAFAGSLSGNVVNNGTINVEGGGVLIIGSGPANASMQAPALSATPLGLSTITGTGMLRLNESSMLTLNAVDNEAIQFSGPSAVLTLDTFGQTGTISGFASTDIIQTAAGLATGVSAASTSTSTKLTFTNGSKLVGTLTLAGDYTHGLFHFSRSAYGVGGVTLQTIGSAPTAPSVITGTSGFDILTATANNQTLTGLGGNDSFTAGKFTGVVFKDTSTNLNGTAVQNYGTTNVFDLTDMSLAKAVVAYTPATTSYTPVYTATPANLLVTDGIHAANISLGNVGNLPIGYFAATTDGGTGTNIKFVSVNTDGYRFNAPLGGSYSTTANWTDTTTGATATAGPSAGNNVTITGGSTGFTTITGNGVAASLTTSGNVMLQGTVFATSILNSPSGTLTQSGTLVLDSGASLVLPPTGSTNAGTLIGGTIRLSGGSKLAGAGVAFTQTGAALQATGGSTAQFSGLVGAPSSSQIFTPPGFGPIYPAPPPSYYTATIAVDATSSVEFGATGNAQKGALTIDTGITAQFLGGIQGNVVLNGTLIEVGSTLSINGYGTAVAAVTGNGTIAFGGSSETLQLTGSDSAAIQFAGTSDILVLGSILPTGTISGFGVGDTIVLTQAATGFKYNQGTTGGALTLQNGAANVGTVVFAGTYNTNQFSVQLASDGHSSSLVYLPGPIMGTSGFDNLVATANNETLTGLGGNDLLSASVFTGISFKDTSINLNGGTIQAFGPTDVIDLIDMSPAKATVTYTPAGAAFYPLYTPKPASLLITDGTHTAGVTLSGLAALPVGYFATSSDGGTGTNLKYVTVNTDAYSFSSLLGGSYSTPANWTNTTTNVTATVAPAVGNNVTIAGGSIGYTNITGNGVAANLTTSGDVLIWGTVSTASLAGAASGTLTQSGTLTLDGGASLVLPLTGSASNAANLIPAGPGTANAGALIGGLVQLTGASKLTGAAGVAFTQNGAALQVTGGSTAQFAVPNSASLPLIMPTNSYASAIGVDATSSIEFGTAGNAQKGALTVDAGVTEQLSGVINGNIVLNGTLIEAGGTLSIGGFGNPNASITGSGTLVIGSASGFGFMNSTLKLTGSDSAAIQFFGTNDVLALGSILPTGLISGFAAGDSINVAQAVTGFKYTQGVATGVLMLLNGNSTIGTLTFAGIYAANQFQVQLSSNGQSSTLAYLQAPNTVVGNQVSVTNHAYTWSASAGGDWTNAANWSDTTTAATAAAAPGSSNAVTFSVYSSGDLIVSGSGSAASLTANMYSGRLIFTGNINVAGSFNSNGFGGYIGLTNAANFTVGSLSQYAALQINAGSTLNVTGTTAANAISGMVDVLGGSNVKLYSGAYVGGTIAVDGSSTFELGTTGNATPGAVTFDAGITSAFSGTIMANVVVNGTLTVNSSFGGSATIGGFAGTTGSITGSGTIALSGNLKLNAADSVAISFQPFNLGTLELGGPLPTGIINGFAAGDIIQIDKTVTGLSYAKAASQGTLTLLNGANIVGTLALAGSFTGSMFHVDVSAATGFATISVLTQPTSNGTATANTSKDSYNWLGTSIGGWAAAANWNDTTLNTTPTTVPGSGNAVTITGTSLVAIGGNGAAASLTDSANLLLTGQVTVAGQLKVNALSGPPAALTLDAGAQITAASAMINGRLQAGGGSSATVTGTATVQAGTMLALNGSTIKLGALVGNSEIIAIDANSRITVGAVASPSAGALTEATGSTIALSGAIYGNVVANGVVSVAAGASLSIDMNDKATSDPYGASPGITGTGTLTLSENSTLSLGATDSVAIQFNGPNATLALAKIPTATISGFVAGDQILLDQPVTGAAFSQATNTLTLTSGTTAVGALKLSGNFSGSAFHLDSSANGTTAVISLQSLGVAQPQPTLIQGTAATDILSATANGQTLIGLGGGDTLNGANFTAITFKDLTANLAGSAIQHFATTDVLDFTDMISASTTTTYTGGTLTVGDGTHSASLNLSNFSASGAFHVASDGAFGTKLTWS